MRYLFLSVAGLCGLSKAEDIPLGTYVGSSGDDGSGYSKVVMTVKPGLVADFKFDSNWSGYGSAEPLTGECQDVSYEVSMRNPPHFTFHLGFKNACIQGLVDKWNAQTQSSRFLGPPFNFWYTHGEDRMDTGESLGYNIIIVKQPVDIEEIAVRFDGLMSNIAAEIRDANEQVSSNANADDGVDESKQENDQEDEENSVSDEDDQEEDEHGAHYLNAVMQLNEDLEEQDEQNWNQLIERDEETNEWRGFVGYEGDDYDMDQLNALIQQEEDEQESFVSGDDEDEQDRFGQYEDRDDEQEKEDNNEESDDVNDDDDDEEEDDAPEYQESGSDNETTVAPENVGAE